MAVGSKQKIDKNKWRLFYSVGSGRGRKRFSKVIEGFTEKQADKELLLWVAECDKETPKEEGMVFDEFVRLWKRDHANRKLKQTTLDGYNALIEGRILPYFKDWDITTIKPTDVNDFLHLVKQKRLDGVKKEVSDKTVLNVFRLVKSMLEIAYKWRLIKENPCEFVEAPQRIKIEADIIEYSDLTALMNLINKDHIKWRLYFNLALVTGMRNGELVGLKWEDVDLQEGMLFVRRSRYATSKGVIEDTPKSRTSIRALNLPPYVIELFKEYGIDEGYVFRDKKGTDGMHPSAPNQKLNRLCLKNGLPKVTMKMFRHTSASILLENGLTIKEISENLGHADVEITGKYYLHNLHRKNDRTTVVFEKLTHELTLQSFK